MRSNSVQCAVRRARCAVGGVTCATLVAVMLGPVAALRADIIDRILAVVSGGLILQSDAVAAIRLGLVEVPSAGDRVQGALDKLIERRLMLVEVDRYRPPEPSDVEVDAGVAAMVKRIVGTDTVDAVLRETGFTSDQLRLYVRDDLRIRTYLQQRFGASLEPADEEILEYYRAHESEFARGGAVRPFVEVRDEARSALIAERRAALIGEWLAGLRRRAEVTVLYLPPR